MDMERRLVRDFLPGSSDIDWCETNYVESLYIAEYYNTVSNVFYLVMPPLFIFLFRHYSRKVDASINVVWVLLAVVGLGSIYFHSTLSFAGQLIDELAIAWVLLAGFAIWTPKRMLANRPFYGSRRKFGQFAAFLGMLVILLALVKPILNAFILLCVAIPAMVLVITEMKGCREKRAWRLCYGSVLWLLVAVTVWLSDRINCNFWLSIHFPYLHSFWHIFILLGSYPGCVLCAYLHARRETPQLDPQIHYWPTNNVQYGVPYVHVHPPIYSP